MAQSDIAGDGGARREPPSAEPDRLEAERRALIVLGVHRSGTSAVTRVLNLLGARISTNLMPPAPDNNETGFWEPADVVRIHDELLAALGSSWDDVQPLPEGWLGSDAAAEAGERLLGVLRRDFDDAPLFVVKDPRMCRLLPLWRGVLERFQTEPAFVIMVRHPFEVCGSLGKRDGFIPAKSELLWLRHLLDLERDSRGFRRSFVSYERFLADWSSSVDHISRELGVAWPARDGRAKAAIDGFLSPDLRHHAFRREDFGRDASGWLRRAHLAMLEAAEGNADGLASTLDGLREEIEAVDAVFVPLLAESHRVLEVERKERNTERSLWTAESERLNDLIRAISADRDATRAGLDVTREERDAIRADLDATRRDLAAAQSARDTASREVRRRRTDVEHLAREMARLNAALGERLRELEESGARLERSNRELAARENRVHTLHAELTTLLNSRSVKFGKPLRVAKKRLLDAVRPSSSPRGPSRMTRGGRRLRREAAILERSGLFDEAFYLSQDPSLRASALDPIRHYLEVGAGLGLDPHPLFDTRFYLNGHPEVAAAGANPLVHFLEIGASRGYDPNELFDTSFYLERHPDVAATGVNALCHYVERGAQEGYDPHPDFDTDFYLSRYPDVFEAGINPLQHYLRAGRAEARVPAADSLAGYWPPAPADPFECWLAVNGWNERVEQDLRERLAAASGLPKISVVVPVYNPPADLLRKAIRSVMDQVYDNWQLSIADDASSLADVGRVLGELEGDARVRTLRRAANGGISAATNDAAAGASGDFLVFLDHDDELAPEALAEIALYVAAHPETDMVYSDGDKIDLRGRRYDAAFKPDWSPELLLSYMYCAHAFAIRRSLFEELGGMRLGFEGSQDHDLALRASERARHVGHVPKILYHWRAVAGSTAVSGTEKPYSFEAGRKAVQEALERRGSKGIALQPDWARRAGNSLFVHDFPDEGPSVTIVVPTKNGLDLLRRCLASLRTTTYGNYQVLVVDNESDDPETLEYLHALDHQVLRLGNPPGGFNFAYLCDVAAGKVDTDYVLFLNNDTEVLEPRWLSRMVGYAELPGVGTVGALLHYPDGRVQHAGVVGGYHDGAVGHAFKLLPAGCVGYLAYAAVARNYSAVTAACLLTPRRLFLDSGAFDHGQFGVAFNDVDYCYRLVEAGHRVVYCPGADLRHYEGASRGFVDRVGEVAEFRRRYEGRRDPFYNPNLSLDDELFRIQPRHVASSPTRPVRALLCTHNLNWEGAPKILHDAAVWLKARGVLDPVVASPSEGPLRHEYEAHGIPVHVVATPLSRSDQPIVIDVEGDEYARGLAEFCGFVRSLDVEVVWVNTILAFFAIDAARELGLPSVWHVHESEGWRHYYRATKPEVGRRLLECFTHPYRVVFSAHGTRREFEALNARHNFAVVHNGLDRRAIDHAKAVLSRSEARQRLGVSPDDVVLLSLGTVCDRKGQMDLVRAIAEAPQSDVERLRIFVVGDRSHAYGKQVAEAVRSLPASHGRRFRLVDPTPDTALYYRAADIFVLTSHLESYPRVILEAMAYELPIICTPVFGVAEQVAGDVNASIYAPGDVAGLRATILDLARDRAKRARYARAAIPVLSRRSSFEEQCRQYGEFVQEAYFTAVR